MGVMVHLHARSSSLLWPSVSLSGPDNSNPDTIVLCLLTAYLLCLLTLLSLPLVSLISPWKETVAKERLVKPPILDFSFSLPRRPSSHSYHTDMSSVRVNITLCFIRQGLVCSFVCMTNSPLRASLGSVPSQDRRRRKVSHWFWPLRLCMCEPHADCKIVLFITPESAGRLSANILSRAVTRKMGEAGDIVSMWPPGPQRWM